MSDKDWKEQQKRGESRGGQHGSPGRRVALPWDRVPGSEALTRRGFVAGVLGVGAAAIAAGGSVVLGGCSSASKEQQLKEQQFEELVSKGVKDDDIEVLTVAAEQLVEAASFDEAPFEDYLRLEATWELPLGSLVYQIDSFAALALLPGERGESFRKIGMLDLGSGEVAVVVPAPLGTGRNVIIYDARASRTALIWVELDLGSHQWGTFVAALDGTRAGEARLVEEGDADWEPSMLAVAGSKAYWTVMPVASGAASLEDSRLRAFELGQGGAGGAGAGAGGTGSAGSTPSAGAGTGQGEPYTVLTSHGRMITNPHVTDGIVTFVPRVDTANVYYQLTALDCSNDKPVDFKVLPQSLKVTEALYARGGFSFSIEDNYKHAEGLARFGIYQDLGDGSYLHVSKPPASPLLRFGDCLIIKAGANIMGIDPVKGKSFIIERPPRCADFGESLIGSGIQDKVVTSSVRMSESDSGMEATTVRVFG